ncbi:hypothetical protein M0813_06320 [Anaeramoeba flamelloides]|uniref:Uncharacterized protein n=1 Tax=Anaeramoeba flamelloides TaxID=1746091 RepID=A0ABQ8XEQ5_9EUKA|nr:hypothetical protein M0813_06320 [Anaeramoeba flamelloides]
MNFFRKKKRNKKKKKNKKLASKKKQKKEKKKPQQNEMFLSWEIVSMEEEKNTKPQQRKQKQPKEVHSQTFGSKPKQQIEYKPVSSGSSDDGIYIGSLFDDSDEEIKKTNSKTKKNIEYRNYPNHDYSHNIHTNQKVRNHTEKPTDSSESSESSDDGIYIGSLFDDSDEEIKKTNSKIKKNDGYQNHQNHGYSHNYQINQKEKNQNEKEIKPIFLSWNLTNSSLEEERAGNEEIASQQKQEPLKNNRLFEGPIHNFNSDSSESSDDGIYIGSLFEDNDEEIKKTNSNIKKNDGYQNHQNRGHLYNYQTNQKEKNQNEKEIKPIFLSWNLTNSSSEEERGGNEEIASQQKQEPVKNNRLFEGPIHNFNFVSSESSDDGIYIGSLFEDNDEEIKKTNSNIKKNDGYQNHQNRGYSHNYQTKEKEKNKNNNTQKPMFLSWGLTSSSSEEEEEIQENRPQQRQPQIGTNQLYDQSNQDIHVVSSDSSDMGGISIYSLFDESSEEINDGVPRSADQIHY